MKDDKLKDNWRFSYIGDRDWIIDSYYSYNPEDDIIEALDNKDADQVNYSLSVDESSNEIDLHNLLDKLPERYSSILWDYYFEGKTLQQIGDDRNYSKQYAHQEFNKAIIMIRELAGEK
jgi:RNA polymerase sigma factor (sigma-70 family)